MLPFAKVIQQVHPSLHRGVPSPAAAVECELRRSTPGTQRLPPGRLLLCCCQHLCHLDCWCHCHQWLQSLGSLAEQLPEAESRVQKKARPVEGLAQKLIFGMVVTSQMLHPEAVQRQTGPPDDLRGGQCH